MLRRSFLASTAAFTLAGRSVAAQAFVSNPFALGVASSVPRQGAVTLWTRLAPVPTVADGGLDPVAVPVRWELAEDEGFGKVLARGMALALPEYAHSVRVTVDGLAPGRTYWYRFASGDAESRIGRTKTLPADPAQVRFATASCQHFEQGYFVAYDHMIADDPDFVLHLGDFIYGVSRGGFRNHLDKERPVTLDQYRVRHALYNTDESLQAARASFPFHTVLDNHDALPDVVGTPEALAQRANAYRAWFEHMPMEGGYTAGGTALYTHASLDFGPLMRLTIMDTRQFRDDENLCRELADPEFGFTIYRPDCDPIAEAGRSMLGRPQEAWVTNRLTTSETTWNALGSTVLFSPFDMHRSGDIYHYESSWDYYPENRKRLLASMGQATNPVMLSADVHSNWAIDIQAEPGNPDSPVIGAEMLATSISSGWPGPLDQPMADNVTQNPHVKHYNGQERGYMLHSVTADTWTTDMRVVDDVQDRNTPVRTQARFVVEAGNPGVQAG